MLMIVIIVSDPQWFKRTIQLEPPKPRGRRTLISDTSLGSRRALRPLSLLVLLLAKAMAALLPLQFMSTTIWFRLMGMDMNMEPTGTGRLNLQIISGTTQSSGLRLPWLLACWQVLQLCMLQSTLLCVFSNFNQLLHRSSSLTLLQAVYSSPYVILFSFISAAYLALVYTITFPTWVPFYHSKYAPAPAGSLNTMQEHKQATFLHLYIFTWILLVFGTVGITRVNPGVAGGYLITIWNGLLLIACALCVLEGLTTRQDSVDGADEHRAGIDDGELPRRSHRHVEDAGVDADERTPLIWHGANEGRAPEAADDVHESLGTWWWLPQFLVSVPIPVILWAQVVMLLLDAMPQSLADGGKPLGGKHISRPFHEFD